MEARLDENIQTTLALFLKADPWLVCVTVVFWRTVSKTQACRFECSLDRLAFLPMLLGVCQARRKRSSIDDLEKFKM